MSTIQSFPIINSSDGILFTQDANNNIAISVDSTVTVQGNTFNGASELVKLDAYSALPAADGSKLTGLTSTQIGGLSTNFADVSLSNINATAKSKITNLPMPSNSYIDLTLGANGSTYTAPANGWVFLDKFSNAANEYIHLVNASSGAISNRHNSTTPSQIHAVFLPARKNDMIQVYYNLTGSTNYFRFVYAQGEV